MHSHIQQLHQLAAKPERLIVGLMSGTSLDGLDVALCRIHGAGLDSKIELLEFTTLEYDDTYRRRIKSVFSKRQVDLQQLCVLNPWVGSLHGEMVRRCLETWRVDAREVDLIASHGQTVYHAPKSEHQLEGYPNATLQIGDGDHLACRAGIITLSDFRQKHLAAGGEGAPLAVYGDYLIFASPEQNRVMLNMGGIANMTYLPSSMDAQTVFSTDVGPGNTLMDAYMQQHFQQSFDANAAVASTGKVCEPLLRALQQHSFFALPFPKTTGPELFNLDYLTRAQAASQTVHISHPDIMATLNQFSANMIAMALKRCAEKLGDYHLYASGGGFHNPLLMENITKHLPKVPIHSTAELQIDPDAKEAVLFAVLANECVAGGKDKFSNLKEGIPDISMGKVSFYD